MRRYGVDAAILYSDIVVPVAAIGFGVDVAPGTGPVVGDPFRGAADLDRLRPLDPEADTPYVLETVRILAKELTVPLIGFAGAPFTVASYLVEGGPTRTWAATKRLMFGDPSLWDALLDRLADLAIASLRSQVVAGAQAVQLFDSWAGQLHPADYRRYVLPHSAKVLAGVADLGVPRIHFGVGTGELLGARWPRPAPTSSASTGASPLDDGPPPPRRPHRSRATSTRPSCCASGTSWPARPAGCCREGATGGPGHIFNLGHGVMPETDPATLERLVDLVHGWSP